MPPRKGTEPTKVLRLPVWLLDQLASECAEGETVPGLITRRLAPRQPSSPGVGADATRCTCKAPVLSKHVTSLCITCKLLR